MSGHVDPDRKVRPERLEDPSFLERFKEFGPTSFAVDHSTSMIVLLVIICFMGLNAYRTTPKESFPEVEVPIIAVNTLYPGVSPADMETLVTRPMEDELSQIAEIEELTSTSVEGYSSVVAEFSTTIDIEDALNKVREKVDLARPELPTEAEEPAVVEFDVTEVPIMQVNLSGEYGLVRLKEIAEDMQDELEQISSVLRIDVRGGLEREVQVDVDLRKLQYYGMAIGDVIDAIRDENVNTPGGTIDVGTTKYLVRVDGEFDDPAVIEELVVMTRAGRPIYIRDVASVDFGFAERSSFARLDGAPVVTLDVLKRSGENIIETVESVKEVIAEMEPLFPPTTVVKITSDQSRDIEMMVSSLENNIVSGLLLIIAVLLFFLGLGNSIFVAISIPASMLLSFIVLQFWGVTMNMVVLFSLILALGMLVDNAIVVVENIYRYLEEGWTRQLAAKKATGEVAMPVIAATATTLAAFAPLLFWPGTTGEFMSYLPKTLIVTLASSLFVAIIIIPTLCSMFMEVDPERRKPLTRAARLTLLGVVGLVLAMVALQNALTAGLVIGTAVVVWVLYHFVLLRFTRYFQDVLVPLNLRVYESALRTALDRRALVIGGSAAVLVATVFLFSSFNAGIEYFPEDIPPRQIFVDVDLPVGTRSEATNELLLRVEDELRATPGIGDIESTVAVAGGGGGANAAASMAGQGGPSGPDAGRASISFIDFQDRENDTFETLAWLQSTIGQDIAGAEVTVEAMAQGPSQGAPVNIEIVGEDPGLLKELADQAVATLEASEIYPQLVGLESDLDAARPELSVRVDREKAALYDLSTAEVGRAIRGAINGIEAAKYRSGNDEYDIIVRLAEEFRSDIEGLRELTVMADGGRQIPLLSVADWEVQDGYGSIRRKDQTRMATISSDVAAGLNSNAVLMDVQRVLTPFADELPPGYSIRYTGQQQEQAEAQEFLGAAFIAGIFLIGFILVSQFNSVVKPAIILTSVVMSTVGVLLGLMLFRMPFGVIMTGVGIISLAGIVVNNAIVLIDYIDILRERDGLDRREALVAGGKTRFRPVVLTATTTALGLVPLAIGLNFDFFGLYSSLDPDFFWGGEQAAWWGPMAVAVIAGILFATFLTLILVPALYSLVDDFASFFRRVYTHEGEEVEASAPDEAASAGGSGGPATPPVGRPDRELAGAMRRLAGQAELRPQTE